MFSLWYFCAYINGRYPKNMDEDQERWLDQCVDTLSKPEYRSLLKRCLNKTIYSKVKGRRTVNGIALKDIIKPGLLNPDSGIGVYAMDPDSYFIFNELFDPIIEAYHLGFKYYHKTPGRDYGNPDKILDLDPTGHYINSIRIRCNRCLDGYPFNTKMSEDMLIELERKISIILKDLQGEFHGFYYSLNGVATEIRNALGHQKFIFENTCKILDDAGVYSHWPVGRGVYYNHRRTLLIWINEEDHIRLVSMQKGGDLKSVYLRYIQIMNILESKMPFRYDTRLGYINFSIMNLGIALRVTVQLVLPNLNANEESRMRLREFCRQYQLCYKATEPGCDVYDVFTRKCLGVTEFECLTHLQTGIFELIRLERYYKEKCPVEGADASCPSMKDMKSSHSEKSLKGKSSILEKEEEEGEGGD